ncbi:glycosyltransferase [Hyphomonas sp. FCG-A18]|uniref:glycosyltransferase n=1 Tax=Hyphomonas sp. FCG-A18 TaxID=3080019 RepID=UPI002B305849|nr:glycosyltransferase [Hyphomonas sp. FCG-A18]
MPQAFSNGIAAPTPSQDTVIVVPCYNEAERLNTNAFVDFALTHPGLKFLFVDDGSKDGTLAILAGMQIRAPHVLDVLALPQNGGKAEAVRQGLLYASRSGARAVGYFDADLATPLEAIVDLGRVLDNLESVDVVFGSRQMGLGRKIFREPKRRLVSFICASLARVATGLPFSDTQCGAKLFRNSQALRTAISTPFKAGWLFDVELALRLSASLAPYQQRFYELPLMEWTEIEGSKITSTDVFRSGFVMLGLIAKRWSIKHEFRRRADQTILSTQPKVTLYGHFDQQDIASLRLRAQTQGDFAQIDLSQVEQFGPSVFPALIGICDSIRAHGVEPSILLPDDDAICQAAERSGLVALYDCRRVIAQVPAKRPQTSQDTTRKAA